MSKKLTLEALKADNGAELLARLIHKVDPLSRVTDCYEIFLKLVHTTRGANETLRNFESRFQAQACRLNDVSHSSTTLLPDSLVSIILLSNRKNKNNQRISILAASAPKANEVTDSTNVFDKICYENIASIIRSSDNPETEKAPIVVHAGSVQHYGNRGKGSKKTISVSELADLKSKSTCHSCCAKGHWANDQKCEQRKKKSDRNDSESSDKSSRKRTVTFNMCCHMESNDDPDGPLVDDGAPYSGMGAVELSCLVGIGNLIRSSSSC